MGKKETTDWRDALASLASPDELQAAAADEPTTEASSAPTDTLTIFFERKGRGGKQATIIAGFSCSDDELRAVASSLKQTLACGGSARGGEILIQGDRREDAAKALRRMGYKVK